MFLRASHKKFSRSGVLPCSVKFARGRISMPRCFRAFLLREILNTASNPSCHSIVRKSFRRVSAPRWPAFAFLTATVPSLKFHSTHRRERRKQFSNRNKNATLHKHPFRRAGFGFAALRSRA